MYYILFVGCTQAVCEHQHFVTVGRYHPVNLNYFITGTLDKLCCWDMRNTVRPAKTYVYKDKFGQAGTKLIHKLLFCGFAYTL